MTGRVVHSDTPRTGTFACSNALVNQLLAQHRLGPARQLPLGPDRLPAARRAPRLAGRRAGLRAHRDASTWTSRRSSPSGATTSLDAQSPDGAYPRRRAAASRSRRRHAGLGRRRRSSCRGRSTGATATRACSSATGDAMERYIGLPRAPQPGPAVDRARAATTTATGCRSARTRRATCSPPPTSPTTRRLMAEMAARARHATTRAAHYERLRAGDPRRLQRAPTSATTAASRATPRPRTCSRCTWTCCRTSCAPRAAERLVDDIETHDGHLTTGFVGVGAAVPGAQPSSATPTSPTRCCSSDDLPVLGLLDPPRRDDDLGALGRLDRGPRLPDRRR